MFSRVIFWSQRFNLGEAVVWCIWTVVLEKILESPLDCKEIQPVHSEGDQPWDFFGRNDAKAEAPVLWPPHVKSWLIGKDSDARRDWGQEEKGTTKDEMAGWHHGLDGRESEWTPGDGDGQGGLACCDSWGRKESDTTEWLKWTEVNWTFQRLLLALSIIKICHLWCKVLNKGPLSIADYLNYTLRNWRKKHQSVPVGLLEVLEFTLSLSIVLLKNKLL